MSQAVCRKRLVPIRSHLSPSPSGPAVGAHGLRLGSAPDSPDPMDRLPQPQSCRRQPAGASACADLPLLLPSLFSSLSDPLTVGTPQEEVPAEREGIQGPAGPWGLGAQAGWPGPLPTTGGETFGGLPSARQRERRPELPSPDSTRAPVTLAKPLYPLSFCRIRQMRGLSQKVWEALS